METQQVKVQEEVKKARVLVSEGQVDKAVKMLEDLHKACPGSGEVCALLCRSYMKMKRPEIRKEIILNALSHDAGLGMDLIEYASQLTEDSAFRESNTILEALVWGNPDNFEAWNDLGAVRYAMNDLVTAEKAFNQALALNPWYGETLLNLTALYLETNRPDLAVDTARTASDERCDVTREMLIQLAGLISAVDTEEAANLLRVVSKAQV